MPTRERRLRKLAKLRGEIIPENRSNPASLRSRVTAACREMVARGIRPTGANLAALFPGSSGKSLVRYRNLAGFSANSPRIAPIPRDSFRNRVIAVCEEIREKGGYPDQATLQSLYPDTPWSTLKSYRNSKPADHQAKAGSRLQGRTPKARAIEIRALNTACIRTAEEREAKRLARLRRGPAVDRWTALQRQSSGRAIP